MKKELKLNLGCGENQLPGFINIDNEPSCKPDLVCNILTQKFPYKPGSVSEITFFHCIEHIKKSSHRELLLKLWRVLKPGGRLLISYPEFLKCVKCWKDNYRGKKDFFEMTIFGRQMYPSDAHVCIMHTPDFLDVLRLCGFEKIVAKPELGDAYNTVVSAYKGTQAQTYHDILKSTIETAKVRKVVK